MNPDSNQVPPVQDPNPATPTVNNPTPTLPVNSTIKSVKKRGSLLSGLFMFIGIATFTAALVIGLLIASDNNPFESKTDTKDTELEDDSSMDTEDVELVDDLDTTETVDVTQIVYIKDNNVWVVDVTGENKEQITTDGDGSSVQYTSVDWKEDNVISYAKCASSCAVYSYDLNFDTETIQVDAIPFTQIISDITWSHNGEDLGYIFQKGDYSWEAAIVTLEDTITIKTWPEPAGRGVGYDDGIDFRWSEDDTKVAVLNTLPAPSFPQSLVIADADGTTIATVENSMWPSFSGSNLVYYKEDAEIKKFNIAAGLPTVTHTFLGTENGHNIEVSPSGDFLSYWYENTTTGQIDLVIFDISSSPATVANNILKTKWVDEDNVVGLRTTSPFSEFGFESTGISRVELGTGSITDLDTGAIYNFEVE